MIREVHHRITASPKPNQEDMTMKNIIKNVFSKNSSERYTPATREYFFRYER